MEAAGELTARIARADREVEALCAHPETAALRQVTGVGPITALTFVLTVEDPARFPKNREVGAYLMPNTGDCDRLLVPSRTLKSWQRPLEAGCPYMHRARCAAHRECE